MRGLAALVVVFHHGYTRLPGLFQNYPVWLLGISDYISGLNVQAVLFFFFLSGFSICLSIKNDFPVTVTHFNYYTYRRFKRILPLYYFAIAFTLLAGLLAQRVSGNDDFSTRNLLGNVFFLQCSKSYKRNWFAPYGENGPLWSLSFEMFYYFLLPAFIWLLLKVTKKSTFSVSLNRMALLAAFVISVVCLLLNKVFFFPFIAFASLFYVWYSGFFVARLYLFKELAPDKNFLLLVSITGILILLNNVILSATAEKLLFGSLIATAFVLLLTIRKKMPAKLISFVEGSFNFLFYKTGKGSYALYLLHFPVVLLLQRFQYTSGLLLFLCLVAMCAVSIWLEEWFTSQKWLVFKRPYFK